MGFRQERKGREQRTVIPTRGQVCELIVGFDEHRPLEHEFENAPSVFAGRKDRAVQGVAETKWAAAGQAGAVRQFDVSELACKSHQDFRYVVTGTPPVLKPELTQREIVRVAVQIEPQNVRQ